MFDVQASENQGQGDSRRSFMVPQLIAIRPNQCNEEKPRCRNCRIHGASCVYEWERWPAFASTSGRTAPETGAQGAASDGLIFSTRHMMLLHHFTASTASTLHSNVDLKVLWQIEGPQIGLSFHFLLHAILAVSSLHLAYLRPTEWHIHWSQGVELYQTALAGAKKEMQRVSDGNRAALFLFSALTCYFSLARSHCGDRARCAIMEEEDDFLDWVFLFRGTRAFLMLPDAAPLESGPLAPMIKIGKERVRLLNELLVTDTPQLKALGDLQAEIRCRVAESIELEAYNSAMVLLQRSFNAAYHRPSGGLQNTDVFVWLIDVPDEFIALLEVRKPIAMALFACFSVLFQRLPGAWWVGDWSEGVLKQIYSVLRVEKEGQWLIERVQRVAEAEVT